ncbi:hypothetical protein LTR64_005926 [Lithohypha guttulata]|uniref:uncharacterized protein n=1 Tax=Lithohypha guttulata TaxID=1690604 RepID=UPI002DE1BF95|nr:hypothetical protein LTR51_002277 [Lithohypha guttulata]
MSSTETVRTPTSQGKRRTSELGSAASGRSSVAISLRQGNSPGAKGTSSLSDQPFDSQFNHVMFEENNRGELAKSIFALPSFRTDIGSVVQQQVSKELRDHLELVREALSLISKEMTAIKTGLELPQTLQDEQKAQGASLLTRTTISEKQTKEAKDVAEETTKLLEQYLPAYVFGNAPNLPKHTDEEKKNRLPTIIQQQVSRAIANAEVNTYLSYIRKVENKATFLKQYSSIRKPNETDSTHSANLTKQYGLDQWSKGQQLTHDLKEWKDPRTNEVHTIHKQGAPKFERLNSIKKEQENKIKALEEELSALKEKANASRIAMEEDDHTD